MKAGGYRAQAARRVVGCWAVALVLVVCFILGAMWAVAEDRGAEVIDAQFDSPAHGLVQTLSEQLLELIEASRGYVESEPERFFAEVDALLTPMIDFNGFARRVMGTHYRKATPEQRQRFAASFKASLLRTYALSLTRFQDGEVAVLPPDGPPRKPNRRNVKMEIRTSGNVHPLVYTVNLGKDGVWRIGNIVIVGINIGLTFRSQFRSAVSDPKYGGDLDRVIDAWAGVVAAESEGKSEGKSDGKSGL